jgi:hypothetical protein
MRANNSSCVALSEAPLRVPRANAARASHAAAAQQPPAGCGGACERPVRRAAACAGPLALALFALLPVDQRLRCAEVCRGWRAALLDVSLWLRLDLSPAGGVARATEALLRAAAKRAAGGVQALDLANCGGITLDAMCAVAAENGAALVELRMAAPEDTPALLLALSAQQFEQLLRAAPQLRVLDADASCEGVAEARRLLRNEAPFGPLRLRTISAAEIRDADQVRSFAEDAAAHEWLAGLTLFRAPLNVPAALDAVVDVALQRQLTYFDLNRCGLTPASAPSLARLLGGSALRTLVVGGDHAALLDEPAAQLICAALRANTTLTSAAFNSINLFHESASAAALLGALTAHPSLRTVDFCFNSVDGLTAPVVAAAGAALAALVAANAPALHELHVFGCGLGDAGLGPLVDVLPHNTHLRLLECRWSDVSEAFMRDQLLPAVRTNAWLEAKLDVL